MSEPFLEERLTEQHRGLIEKYNKLYKLYSDLVERHSKCKAYVQRANEKYAEARENGRQWRAYLEKHGLIAAAHPASPRTVEARGRSHQSSALKRVTSSQTTEGDANDAPSMAAVLKYEDNDEPEVVSARPVKRRRQGASTAQEALKKVKLEPVSQSNPIVVGEPSSPTPRCRQPARKETSDLDVRLEPLRTPRKHTDGRAWSEEATRPPALQTTVSSLSDGDLQRNDYAQIEASREGCENQLNSGADLPSLMIDRSGHERALQPRSVNITATPRSTSGDDKYRSDFRKYQIVSEDGEDQASQTVVPTAQLWPEGSNERRLKELLKDNPAVQQRQALAIPKTMDSRPILRPKPAAVPRSLDQPSVSKSFPPLRSNAFEPSPPPADPNDEPLRSRKPGTLHLSDFKVNPNYLGSTFAFADPIRGRDARRCLPGCTRPECCGGEFRKLVEVAGLPSRSDAEVLENYLGPDFATLMGAYVPDERKDILIQARAAAFANQFGKHRHAFERRSTPPGFWRTGMPSTQEEEADRKEAARREREKIDERYRDAIRGAGRWIFRDE